MTSLIRPGIGHVVPINTFRSHSGRIHVVQMSKRDLDRLRQLDMTTSTQRGCYHSGVDELVGIFLPTILEGNQKLIQLVESSEYDTYSSIVAILQDSFRTQFDGVTS